MEVDAACEICARTGRPKPSKKISLSHVNEQFNREVQIAFCYVKIRGNQEVIYMITDTGTAYAEGCIARSRNLEHVIFLLEQMWFLRNDAPNALSADDEYHKQRLNKYLAGHNVTFKARRYFAILTRTSNGWMFANVFIVVYVQEMDAQSRIRSCIGCTRQKFQNFAIFGAKHPLAPLAFKHFTPNYERARTFTFVYIHVLDVRGREPPATPTFGCARRNGKRPTHAPRADTIRQVW